MFGDTKQEVGDGSLAIQAHRDVTVNAGLSYENVRTVALDTFRSEFVKMLDMAGAIAEARATNLLNEYIARIEHENRAALENAHDPDFRYSLYTAQKIAARSGDAGLQSLLVELLVQRSHQVPRSFVQLVLSESIDAIHKISAGQINALTLIFAIKHMKFSTVSSFSTLLDTLDKYVEPVLQDIASSDASMSHLEYAGCGTISSTGKYDMNKALLRFYPGAFQTGVSEADVCVKVLSPAARTLLVQCEHDAGHVQVLGGSLENVRALCDQLSLTLNDRKMLEAILHSKSQIKVLDSCANRRTYFDYLWQVWENTRLSNFSLTSVGFAIAHANLSKFGPIRPLTDWIH
ncbi:LPO_1073/Vpar_1526 family protein [Massilia oculi]|uniref:LPO_1073/Vpar_1526 family protein n=1 Tax=Massilia oculi TaxID=945844 RepID=UPI0013B3A0B8|nr:LPO_1073/Vpar_1526 family protein [Massilia oculi]